MKYLICSDEECLSRTLEPSEREFEVGIKLLGNEFEVEKDFIILPHIFPCELLCTDCGETATMEEVKDER